MSDFYHVQVIIENVNVKNVTDITKALEESGLFSASLRFYGGGTQIWFYHLSQLEVGGDKEEYARQIAKCIQKANGGICDIDIRLTDKSSWPYGEYDLTDVIQEEEV